MKPPIRILIVDDHFLLRVGLATSVRSEADMEVVGEAASSAEALRLFEQSRPDIVLMDLRLPDLGGVETTAVLLKSFPEARVLMISSFEGQEDIYRSLHVGARSYLPKSVPRDELLRAIRTVHAGENYLPTTIAAQLVERMRGPALSAREGEVLKLIVSGATNKEIAQALSIAEITVKNHVTGILSKLKATDRTQASTIAIQRGIVHLE